MRRRGAILFDAAGTLIELREPVGETYSRIASEHGVELAPDRIQDAFQRTWASAPPMVFPHAPPEQIPAREKQWWSEIVQSTFRSAGPTSAFSDFDAFFQTLFEAMGPPAWRAVEASSELLTELRARGFSTAIVSNFDRRLHNILERLALAPLLDTVVLASDVGSAKPAPAIFTHALARLALPSSHAVVVGNDPVCDLEGAQRAGLRAIDARTLTHLGELLALLSFPSQEEGGLGIRTRGSS